MYVRAYSLVYVVGVSELFYIAWFGHLVRAVFCQEMPIVWNSHVRYEIGDDGRRRCPRGRHVPSGDERMLRGICMPAEIGSGAERFSNRGRAHRQGSAKMELGGGKGSGVMWAISMTLLGEGSS